MRFFSVLLLFTTVLFHSGCRVLAPRVADVLKLDKQGLPEDPFGAAFKDAAEGLENSQLSSSSGHNVGVKADRSHGASRGSHWQQRYTYGSHGYLGDASRNYQRVGRQGYQHGGYPPGSSGYVPSHAGYQANGHGQGVAGSPHYTFPNQVSVSYANHPSSVGYAVDQYGYQTANGQQLTTVGATAFHGRGKQPVEAYQVPAAYGGHPYPLYRPQRSLPLLPGSHWIKPSGGLLNPTQLEAAKGWMNKIGSNAFPSARLGKVVSSADKYFRENNDFKSGDHQELWNFLQDGLTVEQVQLWVKLYQDLVRRGTVPTLGDLRGNPLHMVNEVRGYVSLPKDAWLNVYRSAMVTHLSYRLRKQKKPLGAIRREFARAAASQQVQARLPRMKEHKDAASIAVQFVNGLDTSAAGYSLFSSEEKEILGDFARKRQRETERRGSA